MQPAIAKRLCTPAAHTGLFGIDNIFVTVNLNERFHYSSFLSVTEWKSQTFYTSQNENVKKLYESFFGKGYLGFGCATDEAILTHVQKESRSNTQHSGDSRSIASSQCLLERAWSSGMLRFKRKHRLVAIRCMLIFLGFLNGLAFDQLFLTFSPPRLP